MLSKQFVFEIVKKYKYLTDLRLGVVASGNRVSSAETVIPLCLCPVVIETEQAQGRGWPFSETF